MLNNVINLFLIENKFFLIYNVAKKSEVYIMAKVLIVTDSASDISIEDEKLYGIKVLPFKVALGDKSYISRIDFNNEKFYEMMANFGCLPSTSQITTFQFQEFYEEKCNEGHTDLVMLLINKEGSATFTNAVYAEKLFYQDNPEWVGKINIHLFDGRSYSAGYGEAVIGAAIMNQNGQSVEELCRYLDDKLSNVIMSDKELAIPESKIMQVIKKSDTKEQIQNVTEQMGVMIYFLIGIGAAICLAAIYIAVNMLVMENRSNISMLKVLGYKDKKINNIVLRVNHILLPIGIACSVPLVLATTKLCMSFLAEYMNAVPKAYIAPKSYVLTALITAFSYFGSLLLLRRKVSKIDMVLSLKGNRE